MTEVASEGEKSEPGRRDSRNERRVAEQFIFESYFPEAKQSPDKSSDKEKVVYLGRVHDIRYTQARVSPPVIVRPDIDGFVDVARGAASGISRLFRHS